MDGLTDRVVNVHYTCDEVVAVLLVGHYPVKGLVRFRPVSADFLAWFVHDKLRRHV